MLADSEDEVRLVFTLLLPSCGRMVLQPIRLLYPFGGDQNLPDEGRSLVSVDLLQDCRHGTARADPRG